MLSPGFRESCRDAWDRRPPNRKGNSFRPVDNTNLVQLILSQVIPKINLDNCRSFIQRCARVRGSAFVLHPPTVTEETGARSIASPPARKTFDPAAVLQTFVALAQLRHFTLPQPSRTNTQEGVPKQTKVSGWLQATAGFGYRLNDTQGPRDGSYARCLLSRPAPDEGAMASIDGICGTLRRNDTKSEPSEGIHARLFPRP